MTTDPYAPYLRQADEHFAAGEIVKAGQIWQAILKRVPTHAEARTGLLKVKQLLDAQKAAAAAPPPAPVPAPAAAPEAEPAPAEAPVAEASPELLEKLLREGCTLYDMGQVEDALLKWDKLLSLAPDHAMARDYANGARRELGLPLLQAGERPSAPREEAPQPGPSPVAANHGEDLDKLLREAVQLYDMGLPEEAIVKWERALELEPHRSDIRGYIDQAQAELARQATAPTRPTAAPSVPTQPAVPLEDAQVAVKLRQAEHLMSLQRYEEAVFTYKQALDLVPGHPRALEGLRQAQAGAAPARPASASAAPSTGFSLEHTVIEMAPEPETAEAPAAQPPSALTRTLPPQREGLKVPSSLDKAKDTLERIPQLKDPRLLGGIAGGLLLFIATCSFVQGKRTESRRLEAVKTATDAAVAQVSQEVQAVDLNESPASVKAEAQEALDAQPLLAYLRAEYLLKLAPGDGAAAQLFQKAQAGLAGGVAGASLAEAERHLQEHNLDAAAKVFDALLRAEPGHADLRARDARVQLALAAALAGQEKWDEAKAHLLLGRALQPGDRTWALRLRILDLAQGLPRGPQRESWLAFLG
jgi:tetratricopeptide (TPR) repeat protein